MASIRRIGIIGGTGFIGSHLCKALLSKGHQVILLSRTPEKYHALQTLPNLQLGLFDETTLSQQLTGCDTLINLVGILNSSDHQGAGFYSAHVELTQRLLDLCQTLGIRRFLHMSALGSAESAPSHYLKSKAIAEKKVLAANSDTLAVTCFRPSIVYGPGDSFFTRFAQLLRFSPGVLLLPSADSVYEPIYVSDLVQLMIATLDLPITHGKSYDICGPEIFSLKSLVSLCAQSIGVRRMIIGLNFPISKIFAHILEYCPGKPYSVDNYLSSTLPNIGPKDNQALLKEIFPEWNPRNLREILSSNIYARN
jgi:nucleoside-diphosphate-sugar epimerase